MYGSGPSGGRPVTRADRPSFTSLHLLVQALVHPGDLRHPPLSLPMIEGHDLVVRPVKITGQVSYLLEQPVRGVAQASPGAAVSTSKSAWQCGHDTSSRLW